MRPRNMPCLMPCFRGEQPFSGTVDAFSPKLGMFGTPPPLTALLKLVTATP